MGEQVPDQLKDISGRESYIDAKEFHSTEISTLNDRTNFFLITQSLFIGGLTIAFSGTFGYIIPMLISLLVIVGEAICLVQYSSGHNVAENIMSWRIYMKHLESSNKNGPWNWFYEDNKKRHRKHNKNLLNKLPLAYMWLIYPLLFSFIWLVVSLYAPGRLVFDSSFITENCVLILSWVSSIIATLVSVGSFFYLVVKAAKWNTDIHSSEK